MLLSSPSHAKRPLPIDWQEKWRLARSENFDHRVKIRNLQVQVQGLETINESTREFLDSHGISSINEVENCLKRLEKEIEDRDADHAELRDENDDLNDQCRAYKASIEVQMEELKVIQCKMQELKEAKSSLETKIDQLNADYTSSAQRAAEGARAASAQLEEKISKLEKSLAELEAQQENLKLELAQNAEKYDTERQDMCLKLDQAKEDNESLGREKEVLCSKFDEANEHKLVLVATLDRCEADSGNKQLAIEELTRSLHLLQSQYNGEQEYIQGLQKRLDDQQSALYLIPQLRVIIESLELKISHSGDKEKEASEEAERLRAEIAGCEGDLEKVMAENNKLQEESQISHDTVSEQKTYIMLLESAKQNLEKQVTDLERKYAQELAFMQEESSCKLEAASKLEHLNTMLQDAQESLSHQKQQMAETEGLVSEKMDIIKDQHSIISAQKSTINEQKLRIETHENAKMIEKDHIRQNEELRRQINALQEFNHESQQKLQMESTLRRSLQERLLELKGTIRVFCRVRPLATNEMFREGSLIFNQQQSTVCVSQATNGLNKSAISRVSKFSFDQVFESTSTNEDIFQEVDLLIQSIFNGFRCCIFAYGQTGSGKSHTMLSPDGIVYRTINSIFNLMKITGHNLEYTILVSFFEIYNEQVIDLVPDSGTNPRSSPVRSAALHGIYEHVAKDTQELVRILQVGLQNRAVGATKMNKDSSRSHTVYSITVQSKSLVDGTVTNGKLNLIDLAGSERLDKSQVTGQQLKETQAINKSLSALGDVIHALGQRPKAHIPFRNSKLTHILQDSLTGKSKTLMLVNVSPALSSIQETVTSLRFAEKVNSTKLREINS